MVAGRNPFVRKAVRPHILGQGQETWRCSLPALPERSEVFSETYRRNQDTRVIHRLERGSRGCVRSRGNGTQTGAYRFSTTRR